MWQKIKINFRFLLVCDYIPKSDENTKTFGYIITALPKNENGFSLFARL